jgi:hypothetical protein
MMDSKHGGSPSQHGIFHDLDRLGVPRVHDKTEASKCCPRMVDLPLPDTLQENVSCLVDIPIKIKGLNYPSSRLP